ncbi:MAG: YkvA family protein, partial [Oscillospiraceae bacterium]
MNLKERASKLKVDIPAIFIALGHPKTPWYAKVVAAIIVGYALSPIDLVPDFIPVLGYLDDVIILPLMISLV